MPFHHLQMEQKEEIKTEEKRSKKGQIISTMKRGVNFLKEKLVQLQFKEHIKSGLNGLKNGVSKLKSGIKSGKNKFTMKINNLNLKEKLVPVKLQLKENLQYSGNFIWEILKNRNRSKTYFNSIGLIERLLRFRNFQFTVVAMYITVLYSLFTIGDMNIVLIFVMPIVYYAFSWVVYMIYDILPNVIYKVKKKYLGESSYYKNTKIENKDNDNDNDNEKINSNIMNKNNKNNTVKWYKISNMSIINENEIEKMKIKGQEKEEEKNRKMKLQKMY